jgi:hypothetical protein
MEAPNETAQMKIFISSTDTFRGSIFYEAIAIEAKNFGLFGATIYRGLFGFGVSSRHTEKKFWEIAEKVPVIIELNDERVRLMKFINHIRPWFAETKKGFLVTISPTEIVLKKEPGSAAPEQKFDPDFVP